VTEPDRVYKVTVEPEQGERGIVKRDVGMYRCPRCDTTFPRVLGRVHYLLVPETEYSRLKKDASDYKARSESVGEQMEVLKKEKLQREESLTRQLKDSVIAKLEAEVRQLEKNVKQLKADKGRLETELEEK
jgi:hypothetical protein